jgi:hypothetical protein
VILLSTLANQVAAALRATALLARLREYELRDGPVRGGLLRLTPRRHCAGRPRRAAQDPGRRRPACSGSRPRAGSTPPRPRSRRHALNAAVMAASQAPPRT